MLVFCFDGGLAAKVDLHLRAHDDFRIKNLSEPDSIFGRIERNYDASHGFEGSPGVDGGGLIDEVFDGLNIVCAEDLSILEVGYEESVRGRCGC